MTTPDLDEVLTRAVPADDIQFEHDGLVRTLMVPWLKPADITEIRGDRLLSYREQFARGAFERAEKAPHRVELVWTHDAQFGNLLGRGVEFINDPRGAVGLFRLFPSSAQKAREALEGSGISIGFRTIRPRFGTEHEGDLITRSEVHLRHAAAVPDPAYGDARVLAVREAAQEAQERAAAQAENDRILAGTLAMLKAGGHALPAEQERWLAEHQPAGVAGGIPPV